MARRAVKLHGSVDMLKVGSEIVLSTMYKPKSRTADGKTVREEVLIYPTQEKELFVFPFLDFYYEFLKALRAASLWVFVGFSFSDAPILSLIGSEATDHKKIIIVSPSATKHRNSELAEVAKASQVQAIDLELESPELHNRIAGENAS